MRLLVTDQIRGMREAVEIELFQEHCREDASTQSSGGSGLGWLAVILKDLAQGHGEDRGDPKGHFE